MKRGLRHPHTHESGRRYALDNLKMCPLCGTVNSVHAFECITCRWHGDFITEPEVVEEGLSELLDRCPDLADVILTVPTKRKRRGRAGLLAIVRWLLRGRIDFKV